MARTKRSEFVSLESHERRKAAVEKVFEESMAEIFPNLRETIKHTKQILLLKLKNGCFQDKTKV